MFMPRFLSAFHTCGAFCGALSCVPSLVQLLFAGSVSHNEYVQRVSLAHKSWSGFLFSPLLHAHTHGPLCVLLPSICCSSLCGPQCTKHTVSSSEHPYRKGHEVMELQECGEEFRGHSFRVTANPWRHWERPCHWAQGNTTGKQISQIILLSSQFIPHPLAMVRFTSLCDTCLFGDRAFKMET